MTSAELRAVLNRLSDSELHAAITIAETILASRPRPRPDRKVIDLTTHTARSDAPGDIMICPPLPDDR